jgi:hypothetical protein
MFMKIFQKGLKRKKKTENAMYGFLGLGAKGERSKKAVVGSFSRMLYVKNKATQILMVKDFRPS